MDQSHPSENQNRVSLVPKVGGLFRLTKKNRVWSCEIDIDRQVTHFLIRALRDLAGMPLASIVRRLHTLVSNIYEYCFWLGGYPLCQVGAILQNPEKSWFTTLTTGEF